MSRRSTMGAEAEMPDSPGSAPGPAPGEDKAAPAGRPYAWLAGIVAAVLLVWWGSSVDLNHAGSVAGALAVAGLFAGSCVLAVTPGVALLSVVARRRPIGPATALGLLFAGAGTAAMAGFWAWFASPQAGRVFGAVLLLASVAVTGVFGRRGDLRRLELSPPLALTLAVGLVFTGFAFIQGGIANNPLRALDARFWVTADNAIPLQFAMRVAAHHSLSGYLVQYWLSSDRPPLQTGFALLQWPLWGSHPYIPYQLLATGLQLCWLPGLWIALRVRGLGVRRICVAVLVTAATGAVFFSSIYVWPKMLSAGLALAAVAIVVSRDDGDRWAGGWVIAVVLGTLGMLAHGGTAFALIALVPFGYVLLRRRGQRLLAVRSVAVCAAAVAALYLPWVLYQRFVDPPGDRLIKWQLAGVIPIDSRGALQTIVQQYQSLSPHQLLANKWENVAALAGNYSLWHSTASDPAWNSSFLGLARLSQLYSLLPAAGPLLLGVFALLLPSGRRTLAAVRPLAIFTGLAIVVWVVVLWGGERVPAIIHEGPYVVLALFIGLCALAVTALPRLLAAAVAVASAAWFAVCWVPGLGFHPAAKRTPPHLAVNGAMLAVCVGGLVAAAVMCAGYEYLSRRRESPPPVQ